MQRVHFHGDSEREEASERVPGAWTELLRARERNAKLNMRGTEISPDNENPYERDILGIEMIKNAYTSQCFVLEKRPGGKETGQIELMCAGGQPNTLMRTCNHVWMQSNKRRSKTKMPACV